MLKKVSLSSGKNLLNVLSGVLINTLSESIKSSPELNTFFSPDDLDESLKEIQTESIKEIDTVFNLSEDKSSSEIYNNWKPACRLSIDERKESIRTSFFRSEINRTNLDRYTQIIAEQGDNWGYDFNWIPYEEEFLDSVNELEALHTKRSNTPGKPKVAIIACGAGRAVIDTLTETSITQVLANDLSQTNIDYLSDTVSAHNSEHANRLQTHCSDVIDFLKAQQDRSIKIFHIANLTHFFDADKITELFSLITKKAAPFSKIFLFYLSEKNWNKESKFLEPLLNKHLFSLAKKEASEPIGFKIDDFITSKDRDSSSIVKNDTKNKQSTLGYYDHRFNKENPKKNICKYLSFFTGPLKTDYPN